MLQGESQIFYGTVPSYGHPKNIEVTDAPNGKRSLKKLNRGKIDIENDRIKFHKSLNGFQIKPEPKFTLSSNGLTID